MFHEVMKKPPGRLIAFLFACALGGTSARAQTTGQLRGMVTDSRGSALPGVVLVVESAGQGVSGRGGVTDTKGFFQVPGLPPGRDYTVRANLPGYASLRLTDVEVSAGQMSTVRLTLVPEAAVRERVEVRARPNIVDLDEAATDTRVSSEFIDALPLLGRNFQDILTLAPGVTDVDGDGNPNIHGSRDTDLKTLVDGVNITDPLTGKIGAQLNIESIQEVEIKTTAAGAEYSRAQGGFANVITKSGGNEFEGTFKFFWRGSALDGDGAGIDDPRLHGGVGESGLRDLTFNDFLPFVSFSGPVVKDHAWFFVTAEYIQKEEPVNALNTAFVRGLQEYRMFAKMTWQATTNHRLAFSVNYDPQEYLNEGLNSFTREETGYTLKSGGTVLALRDTAVLSPMVALETTLSSFDGRPALEPNLSRDTNDNGILYYDRNGNRFGDASERDPGEDLDGDGVFDVFEDTNHNGRLDPGEDKDGDGRLTPAFGCDGAMREDFDCDGRLDNVNEDPEHFGVVLSYYGIYNMDIDHDRFYDRGNEDRNGNGVLDDAAHPTGLYPYGTLTPQAPDRDFTIGQTSGAISGPYFKSMDDRRERLGFRQDLSVYIPGPRGSHDVKAGWIAEREQFSRTTKAGQIMGVPDSCADGGQVCVSSGVAQILLPTDLTVENQATGVSTGVYVQDNFKPVPSLNIGVGLRFDREKAESFGYSFFDPAAERRPYDRLTALVGAEIGRSDFQEGNNDGLNSFGILRDPFFYLFGDARQNASYLTDPMRVAAVARLSRHHSESQFLSTSLGALYPELFVGNGLDLTLLRSLGVSPQQREDFTITNNNLAPRLSVSWDPWQDGRTKLFGTCGRYYDRLFLNTIVGEEGPDYLGRSHSVDPAANTLSPRLNPVSSLIPPQPITPHHHIVRFISLAAPSTTQVDRGLKTPFSDEWTLGFQREISPEVALSVTYINRHYRDQIQDQDVNHVIRVNPLTGEPVDQIGNLIINELGASLRISDGRPDLYILNPFFNQILRIGNYNESFYHGVELMLLRRLSRRWQLQASYTYSRVMGEAEDFQSKLGNDPSTIESEFGYLDYDQRHVVKLHWMTYLRHDGQVGSSTTWACGLPYSVLSRFFALDNENYLPLRSRFGATVADSSGVSRFVSEGRNSERNDATQDVNLNVRKTFVLGKTTAAGFLEVFNLLNSDALRIFTYDPNKGAANPADMRGQTNASIRDPFAASPLQIDGERRFGRRFQVGVQFQF